VLRTHANFGIGTLARSAVEISCPLADRCTGSAEAATAARLHSRLPALCRHVAPRGRLRPDGKKVLSAQFLDPPLCFTPDTPPNQIQAGSCLSESCPKIGDVPKSPFRTVAVLVPSAGTINTPDRVALDRVAFGCGCREHPHPNVSARCAAPSALIERRKSTSRNASRDSPADERGDDVMIRGATPGGLSDDVRTPDMVPSIDHRVDCCDLPERGVIHHGTRKAPTVTETGSWCGLVLTSGDIRDQYQR